MADGLEEIEDVAAVEREAEDIQDQTRKIREGLPEAVDELKVETERLLDWRHYVRLHPVAVLTTAAVVGYWLVPKRRQATTQTVVADALREVKSTSDKNAKLAAKQAATSTPTVVDTLLAAAGGIALKLAMSYAGDHIVKSLGAFRGASAENRVEENNHEGVYPHG